MTLPPLHQVEVAWTVIPILIIVVLFLARARVITSIQNAHRPADSRMRFWRIS
jgi:cytochrome c oxidase subunit 2